jgi:ComF family protein
MVRIAALHTTPLREAIHALKYENCPELADMLARYLIAALLDTPWCDRYLAVDGVLPVPLYNDRLQERGYNQSELLADAFCEQTGVSLQTTWLMRQRSTQSQVGLNAGDRRQNVQDAFVATPAVLGKRIILLDDVYTTGATMQACAAALRDAGAVAVYGLAVTCPR